MTDSCEDLLKMPMGTLFVKMAVPGMIGMLVIGLYNLVDSIFVGQFIGPSAVSAVAMGYTVVLVNQAILSLFATGAVSLFSRAMGKNDRKTMDSLFGNIFWPVSIFSIFLTLLVYNYPREILIFLGATGDSLVLGIEYLKLLSLGLVFAALGPALNFLIRGEGQMIRAMKIISLGTIMNLILDPIFIKVLDMGMSGAAIATIIGQALIVVGDFIHFKSTKSVILLNKKSFKISWNLMPDMMKIGFSGMALSVAIAIQLAILLSLSSDYGEASMIVMSASFRVMCFFYIPLFGISYGLQPVIGANYGAGLYDRVKNAYRYFGIIATIISISIFLFFQIFAPFILSWFITDKTMVEAGTNWFRLFQSSFFVYGFISISIMLFMATGKAFKAALMTLGRQILCFIPLAFTLPHFLGEKGLWLSYPLGDLLVVLMGLFLVGGEFKILNPLKKNIGLRPVLQEV